MTRAPLPPDGPLAYDESALQADLAKGAMPSNHFDWIADLCRPHLGARVLEIGSGHGYLSERLVAGHEWTATDVSDQCLTHLHERFDDDPRVAVRPLDMATYEPRDERFDSVIMVNVLEHIADDGAALRTLHDAIAPGGTLVLYVPAFNLLMSRHDRRIGHYRRYRKPGLRALVQASGFTVETDRYLNAVGGVGWFVICRLLRREAGDEGVVGVFDRVVVPVVRRVESVIRPPFGISLLLVARKP